MKTQLTDTLEIQIQPELKQELQEKAREKGFATTAAYARHLLRGGLK